MSNCFEEAILQRYLEKRLSDKDSQAIAAHVEECERCDHMLARLADAEEAPLPLQFDPAGMAPVVQSGEASPAFGAEVAEQARRLLEVLPNQVLRDVAVWKMEGNGIEQIADKLGCSTRTVDRKLDVIRSIWKEKE